MNKLEENGLSGSGLLEIRGPLVERYNECLVALGIEPTRLTAFYIDGKGWSPQVARDRGDDFYLSNGAAVHYAIIITPDQKGKPVYRPYYSFERYILETIFGSSERAIAYLTSRSGVWLEMNPGLSRFTDPRDLTLLQSVGVTLSDTAGMMSLALEQKLLVDQFRGSEDAWADEKLRQKIIDNAGRCAAKLGENSGDLRFKDIVIMCQEVPDLGNMYVEVFGGTWSLRNPGMGENLLVVAGECPSSGGSSGTRVYNLSDPDLLSRLLNDKFVEISSDWYRAHPWALEDLWESILADVLYSNEDRSGTDLAGMTEPKKKRLAVELPGIPQELALLERFRKWLGQGKTDLPSLSPTMQILLMRPHRNLPPWVARVVWRLISRMNSVTKMPTISLADRFLFDKPALLAGYEKWSPARRNWAVRHITKFLLLRGLTPEGGWSCQSPALYV